MSILQDLYHSEINVSISTFWDGGFDVKLGDDMNGFVAEGNFNRWGEVEPWLRDRDLFLSQRDPEPVQQPLFGGEAA